MLEAKTRLFKSGNSDAIRLNKEISRALNVRPGDELMLSTTPLQNLSSLSKKSPGWLSVMTLNNFSMRPMLKIRASWIYLKSYEIFNTG
ncbi:AbrB/MazE/SpoVT family DNA-binding domain-containing protein [Levilactobacillus suantsaiihabitans]|uniref:AbrB/MazE/SpoVT family DNA-binding domain-containing protein n=1 Tax=Levilactobacillus suantsaiihabitans TaxID=2487722 RepID=UPI00107EF84F|nr:AbrB/MazE/SpoVT family DNA-binding domain-containing protein [Levilactobacillus suantsaiihabitans]